MKRIFKLILFCLLSVTVFSQNFSTVFESLAVNDRFSNMMNLQHYQSTNPEHAVTYFLLAGICDEYMRETNPITMFDFLHTNYRQIDTYLGLVKGKLDDKQARQDRDYFGEIEHVSDKRKIGLEDILNETEKRKASANEYFDNAQTVHNSYVRFANMYNACLFKYREISGNYPNYKTLYLLTTRSLRAEVEKMLADFDSSLVYFESYQQACSKLPHILNVNTYVLKPISTYRLEGLIESDFTRPVVELWDFKTWASDFLKVMDADMAEIRTGLSSVNKALNQQIHKFTTEDVFSDEHKFYKPDNKFQNLIAKYDRNSLVNDLIDYQNQKIQYLLNARLSINDVNDTLSFFLINKLRFYNNLAMQKVALNEEVERLKQRVTIDEVAKYIDFFGEQYNGMDGFSRWCEVEKYNNDQVFDNNIDHLLTFIERDRLRHSFKGQYVTYKNRQIPLGVNSSNDSLVDPLINVDQVLESRGNTTYLLGKENDGGSHRPFLVKINAKDQVEWMTTIAKKPEVKRYQMNINTKAVVLDNGEVMVAGIILDPDPQSGSLWKTFLTSIDSKGAISKFKVFDHLGHPLYLYVDEITEQYLLIGIKTKNDIYDNDELVVGLYNFNDSLLWERQITWIGELVDVIVSNSDFFLISNFAYLKADEKEFSGNGRNTLAAIFIDRTGKQMQVNQYKTNAYAEIKYAHKISNSVFNFIGRIKPPLADAQSYSPFYLLVNDRGELIYSNNKTIDYEVRTEK